MSLSSRSYWIRSCCFLACLAFCFFGPHVASAASNSIYMMSYFSNTTSGSDNNGASGLKLAYSLDGLSYHELNGGAGYVKDTINSSFMRDPSVYFCQDGVYRMVYTTGWSTTSFGYSESTDLLHWTTTSAVNIMSSVFGASVTWAPEIIYDSSNKNYVVYWSSNISGGDKSIYYTTTTDFKSYSSPQVLYNPGYTTIDADIVWNGSKYVMMLKDERNGYKYVYMTAGGTTVLGTYSTTGTSAVTTISGYDAEGATTVKVGDKWVTFVDRYSSGGICAWSSSDGMTTWKDSTSTVATPAYARHATVGTATYSTVEALITSSASTTVEIEFTGTAANADFATASNWFGGATPGAGQTPVIQLGNSVVMSKSPSGTFANLYVGQTGSGALTINGTAKVVVSGSIFLGSNALGCGTITQAGSSSVTANYYVSIGRYGTGTYRIQNGSFTVNNDLNIADILGSSGSLIIEGGSVTASQFFIGSGYSNGYSSGNAVGVVTQSGGTMAVTGSTEVIIGGRNTATGTGVGVGTYNISGGKFTSGSCNVFVGGTGTGTVNQTGGEFVAGQYLSIGRYGKSAGYYNISGGTLTQSNTNARIIVGESGTGTLTVSGSGLVDAVAVGLSNSSTAAGTLNLDGGTLQTASIADGGGTSKLNFNGGTLKAKSSTTSFLSGLDGAYVQAGGAKFDTNGYNVTVGQSLLTGVGSGADGGLTKSGLGSLTLNGSCAYTGATTISGGTLALGVSGSIISSSVIDVQTAGLFDVSSQSDFAIAANQILKGNGQVAGAVRVLGAVQPGESAGKLVLGDVTFASGSQLDIELSGLDAGVSYDVLKSSGTITFETGSRLIVAMADGFTPQVGASFDILDFTSVSGSFSSVLLPTLAGGLEWDTSKLYLNGTISVVPEPATCVMLFAAVVSAFFAVRRRAK